MGYPVADTIGGLTAAFAIAAALANRADDRGCFIDVSMLEAVMSTMGWLISNYLMAGTVPVPLGNDNFSASPSGTFRTGDGLINIAANKQEQFEAVCDVIGRPDLKTNSRFAERQARLENRAALTTELEQAMQTKSAAKWRREMNAVGVPAGRVLSVPDAVEHPQIAGRGMIGVFEKAPGVGRDMAFARPGIKLDGAPLKTETPPPGLGEHTDEILAEIGYTEIEISALRTEKAV
ncbi:MAG: CaiB/BaiF CoA-transferase family protein [Rhodospirillaceae bacterium]